MTFSILFRIALESFHHRNPDPGAPILQRSSQDRGRQPAVGTRVGHEDSRSADALFLGVSAKAWRYAACAAVSLRLSWKLPTKVRV